MPEKRKLIFISSHPTQYAAPLYKYLNEQGFEAEAWYCTEASTKLSKDRDFGVNIKWDLDLLNGYKYRFFKNQSWKPSQFAGFWGLINFGLIAALRKERPAVISVHGWHYFSLTMALLMAKSFGHKVCLRFEAPLCHERFKKNLTSKLGRFFLKRILFPRISYFLYIGEQNRLFYKSMGIADSHLINCPYAVDNNRFQQAAERLKGEGNGLRKRLSIPEQDQVILFSAKYIIKKRPLDVLKAFHKLNSPGTWLIMMGEGILRTEMEEYIRTNALERVILTGFINQQEVVNYYGIADLFVMASGVGETWGLSTNEAMNFNVPVLLSDLTGSHSDLVAEGANGYVFKTGDIDALANKMKAVLVDKSLTHRPDSLQLVQNYSYQVIVDSLKKIL